MHLYQNSQYQNALCIFINWLNISPQNGWMECHTTLSLHYSSLYLQSHTLLLRWPRCSPVCLNFILCVVSELCLTSNVKCTVVKSYSDHHFERLYKIGHPICLAVSIFTLLYTRCPETHSASSGIYIT